MLFFLLGFNLGLGRLVLGLCLVINRLMLHWFMFNRLVLNFVLSGFNNGLLLSRLNWSGLSFGGFLLGWLDFSCFLDWLDFWLVHCWFVLYWFVLDWLVFNRFVLNWLMLNFLLLYSRFDLNWLVFSRFMFLLLSNGLESWCLMLNDLLILSGLHLRFYFMLDLRSFLRRLHFFLILSFLLSLFRFLLFCLSWFAGILLVRLFELFGDISDCGPIFCMFLLLSSHFDVEASGEYFFIKGVPNEVDGIDFGLEDDLKGSRVIFFDLDEFEIREGLFNIFLYCVEVAFDKIEGYVLDLV